MSDECNKVYKYKLELYEKLEKYSIFINSFQIDTQNKQELLELIEEKYHNFLAIFDCSKGGVNFNLKLMDLIISNSLNKDFLETIKNLIYERLSKLVKIIPKNIFIHLKLKTYTIDEFNNVSVGILMNDLNIYYKKLYLYFNRIIKILELILHYDNKYIGLLAKKRINITNF